MTEVKDIERTNLDAHVSLCELRYQALERRIDQIETKLESVETLLLQIRDTLAQQPERQHRQDTQRWFQFQWWLIGALGAVAGWALTHAVRFVG